MLQKILDAMESANFKAAVKNDRLACPECGAKPISIPASGDEALSCARCGTTASAREWCAPAGMRVGNPDEPPAGTRITREVDGAGAIGWTIPASGKSGGLMPFGVIWCTFIGIFTSIVLFAPSEKKGGEMAGWPVFLLLSAFWAVGLGMLYAGCRAKYSRHHLSVERGNLTLRRELFGKVTESSLPSDTVQSIAQAEFYQKNYQPVHGIEIRAGKRKLRFGSMLTEDEKAWLVADLKRVVLGDDANVTVAEAAKVVSARQTYFSIPVPKSEVTQFMVGVILTIMGIGYFIAFYFISGPMRETMGRHSREPGSAIGSTFDFMMNASLVMSVVLGVILLGSGIRLAIRGSRARKQNVVLEGTESEVALRTMEFGRVVLSRVFARAEVAAIRASISGSSNGKPMKRIELIVSGKAQPLARWVDGEKADVFVEEVRGALF